MSLTQFAMVEELAFLVKDNLPCKHLILSMEEVLVNFLQDDTSLDGVLELKPMNPYNRLLVHRLADIFGFSHHSIGEGDERHLILERCPETSIPSILVSDLLWQHDEVQSTEFDVLLRRKEVLRVQRENPVSESSLKEREALYFSARERIFSADECETGRPVKQRPPNNPMVARRMITHALGQRIKMMNPELSFKDAKEHGRQRKDVKVQNEDEGSSSHLETNTQSAKQLKPSVKPKICKLNESELSDTERKVPQQRGDGTSIRIGSAAAEGDDLNLQKDYYRKEHMGAAKRLFANALGIHRKEGTLSKLPETRQNNR